MAQGWLEGQSYFRPVFRTIAFATQKGGSERTMRAAFLAVAVAGTGEVIS